jgi:hypothetical protein
VDPLPKTPDADLWEEEAGKFDEHPEDGPATEKTASPGDATSHFVSASEFLRSPAPEQVVEDMAYRDGVTVIAGESGAGKTFYALCLAADIGDGVEHHGHQVIAGSVPYVSFESDAMVLRLQALQAQGAKLENLYLLRANDPISPKVERDGIETPSLGETFLLGRLQELATDLQAQGRPPIVALFIDTVRASLAGSEDNSETVSAYLRAVRRILRSLPGATVFLLHHSGWQDGEARKRRERGSSAFRGNVDATVYLETGETRPDGAVCLTLRTLKTRDSEKQIPLRLLRRRVDLPGFDRWGKPLSSCVIERDLASREDREQAEAAEREAQLWELAMRVLRTIKEHPEATSHRHLRSLVGCKMDSLDLTISTLLLRRLVTRGKRGEPYGLTAAGEEALKKC